MYGVAWRHIAAPQKGYRNSSYAVDSTLNLIMYKSEPGILTRITHANKVGWFVATAGLPARTLHDQRIITIKSPRRTTYAALYNHLPGHTIPWEAYTMGHLKALGKMMGDMHAVLANYPHALPDVADDLLALNRRMIRYFANADVRQALAVKLGLIVRKTDVTRLLMFCQTLPTQALHMDFVRGNVLFDGTAVTGIIDFEKTGRGTPALDIARTLAFLLVDCKYKREDKVYKYFVVSGYAKRSRSSFAQWQLVDRLVPFFLLHDFYKFLRHNPYESLPQNEHFVRTKAMLLKHGIIDTAHVK